MLSSHYTISLLTAKLLCRDYSCLFLLLWVLFSILIKPTSVGFCLSLSYGNWSCQGYQLPPCCWSKWSSFNPHHSWPILVVNLTHLIPPSFWWDLLYMRSKTSYLPGSSLASWIIPFSPPLPLLISPISKYWNDPRFSTFLFIPISGAHNVIVSVYKYIKIDFKIYIKLYFIFIWTPLAIWWSLWTTMGPSQNNVFKNNNIK